MTPHSQGAAETGILYPFTQKNSRADYAAMQERENSGK